MHVKRRGKQRRREMGERERRDRKTIPKKKCERDGGRVTERGRARKPRKQYENMTGDDDAQTYDGCSEAIRAGERHLEQQY